MKADESKEIKVGVLAVLKTGYRNTMTITKIKDTRAWGLTSSGIDVIVPKSELRPASTQEFEAGHRIEQRPHPCATCPNHGHKACCHEVA